MAEPSARPLQNGRSMDGLAKIFSSEVKVRVINQTTSKPFFIIVIFLCRTSEPKNDPGLLRVR